MTRPDHYAALGVARDATTEEIVRAYRRAARHAHPDKGGNHERMQALNEAKAVLTDPERRARYDAGEDDAPAGPPPIDVKARAAIRGLFEEAVKKDVLNPFQSARSGLHKGHAEACLGVDMHKQAIRRMERQRGRVKAKGDNDLYREIIDQAIDTIRDQIAQLELKMAVAVRAVELLDTEYEPGPQAEEMPRPTRPMFATPLPYMDQPRLVIPDYPNL